MDACTDPRADPLFAQGRHDAFTTKVSSFSFPFGRESSYKDRQFSVFGTVSMGFTFRGSGYA